MKHFLIAAPILLAAAALYVVGFGSGAMMLVAAGVLLEIATWFGLFKARRGRVAIKG